jgi:RHS repeat-associated protein
MSFAEGTTAEQGKQPYKYNAKELDQMHGLNLYDYSARHYDSAIGRFTTVDPLAEEGYSWSPYVYCFDNPLLYTDPNGEWPFPSWETIKQKAKAAGGAVLSFANGAVRAVTDNAALGTTNLRETGAYSNAIAYNLGQDIGDAVSMIIGTIESVAGATEVVAGTTVTVGTGGSAVVVGAPAVVDGAIKTVHGVGTVASGANSLTSQKGRVSEANSNGSSSGGGKNDQHANQKAKQSAGEKYQDAKQKFEELNKKPNKTPEEKQARDDARKQMDHWKNKQDFSGENHSQNAKGNR